MTNKLLSSFSSLLRTDDISININVMHFSDGYDSGTYKAEVNKSKVMNYETGECTEGYNNTMNIPKDKYEKVMNLVIKANMVEHEFEYEDLVNRIFNKLVYPEKLGETKEIDGFSGYLISKDKIIYNKRLSRILEPKSKNGEKPYVYLYPEDGMSKVKQLYVDDLYQKYFGNSK